MTPRLMSVKDAALYLSISPWTIRAYVAEGHLRRVNLPSAAHPGENNRRLLFDVRDLDAFIEARRT